MIKKTIKFDIYIKTSEQTPTYSYTAKQKVMSNDKDSTQITFNLLDVAPEELSGSSASILLYMEDGSFFQKSDVTINRNSVIYTMKPEETRHSGNTKVQIVLNKGTVQTASLIYNFEIERGLEKFPIVEKEIQDWTSLTAEAKAFVEQIKDFTLEGFVENKMGEELANLETNYATRLTGLEQKDNQLTAQLDIEKARIDSFTSLDAGSTTGDAELIDGRIGADGITYANVGGAIRGQLTQYMDTRFTGNSDVGKYIAANGSIYSDNRAKVTDYIPVLPNDIVKLTINYPLSEFCYGLYDVNKTQISITAYNTSIKFYNVVIPQNARYIRVTLTRATSTSAFSDFVFVTSNINSLISKTLEYVDSTAQKINSDISTLDRELKVITPNQLNFVNVKENLYNPTTISNGYIANDGPIVNNSTFRYTDLIKVSPGDIVRSTYDGNLTGQSCQFYNSSGNFFVSGKTYTTAVGTTYFETTVPSGASYIRCNFTSNKATTYVIVKNVAYDVNLSGVTDVTITMKNGYIFGDGVSADVENGYLWEKVCCIGDSLTAGVYSDTYTGKGYPYFLEKMLGCTTTNLGLGGKTTKTWWEEKDTYFTPSQLNFSQYDCFIIFLGTNGGLTGNVNSSEDSLMGYYCKIIEKCQAEAPTASIFLVSFPWSQNRDAYYDIMVPPLETLSSAKGLPIIHLDKSKILTYKNRLVNQPYDNALHYGKVGYLRMASEIKRCINEIVEANPVAYANLK